MANTPATARLIKAYLRSSDGEYFLIGGAGSSGPLDDLTDVDVSTMPPEDGQALVWDETLQQWVPGDPPGGREVYVEAIETNVPEFPANDIFWAHEGQILPAGVTDLWVDVVGDTMVGPLVLYGEPKTRLEATPKFYVDQGLALKSDIGHGHAADNLHGMWLWDPDRVDTTDQTTFPERQHAGTNTGSLGGANWLYLTTVEADDRPSLLNWAAMRIGDTLLILSRESNFQRRAIINGPVTVGPLYIQVPLDPGTVPGIEPNRDDVVLVFWRPRTMGSGNDHVMWDVARVVDLGALGGNADPGDYARVAENGYTYTYSNSVWEQISPDTSQIHHVMTYADLFTIAAPLQRGDVATVVMENDASYILESTAPNPTVWMKITSGAEHLVQPTEPQLVSDGTLWVDTSEMNTPGQVDSLDDLIDVDLTPLPVQDKQRLAYDANTKLWKPVPDTLDSLRDVDTTASTPSQGVPLIYDVSWGGPPRWIPGLVPVSAVDNLDDVDVSTTPPTDNQALTFDTASSTWIPEGPHLKLTGGTLTGLTEFDAQVNFDGHVYLNSNIYPVGTVQQALKWPNAEGDKLYLYPGTTPGTNSFGLGVAAGTLSVFSGGPTSKVSFREGGHDGSEWAYANSGGLVSLGRQVATKPDSEAIVTVTGATLRTDQNYIYYNDSIVCWYVSVTPAALWEGSWKVFVNADGYPDFLRPARLIERWKSAPNGTHNATAIAIGIQIEPSGVVSCWKPGDGPDIETTTVINFDFVYPRNY